MSGGLDHLVHAVRDLEQAAELYRRLGFTVGARNQHSWGTHNHLVQLPGFFLELLTVAEVLARLQVGRSPVYDLIRPRRLPSVSIGRCRRIPASALGDFIAGQMERAA